MSPTSIFIALLLLAFVALVARSHKRSPPARDNSGSLAQAEFAAAAERVIQRACASQGHLGYRPDIHQGRCPACQGQVAAEEQAG